MKRIISFLLFAAILVSVVTLPSCSKKNADENSDTPLKLGIGVKYYSDKPTSAKDSKNGKGEKVPNYTNGCIEDPRLFWVEGECYCTAACRYVGGRKI